MTDLRLAFVAAAFRGAFYAPRALVRGGRICLCSGGIVAQSPRLVQHAPQTCHPERAVRAKDLNRSIGHNFRLSTQNCHPDRRAALFAARSGGIVACSLRLEKLCAPPLTCHSEPACCRQAQRGIPLALGFLLLPDRWSLITDIHHPKA